MSNQGIDVLDYHAGDETDLSDPTDPTESVDREFMNKLAQTITKVEECLQVGSGDLSISDLSKFIVARGDVLDMLEDPEMQAWLQWMRERNRSPFRRFGVSG